MHVPEFAAAIGVVSLAAGFLGSLTGLGGGVVITPALVLLFGVDLRYAMGASLASVIATSSGAAASYVKEGLSNVRIAMFLEMATTMGAVTGAAVASRVSNAWLSVIFGFVLVCSAFLSRKPPVDKYTQRSDTTPLAARLRLSGSYIVNGEECPYAPRNLSWGFLMMAGAGLISGLLGIGSGAFKVLAMDRVMQIPFKVSTSTSNFMIGVTAAAGAGLYWRNGYIEPTLAMGVILGALVGSMLGARILPGASSQKLRLVFAIVIGALGLEMIYGGFSGRI